MREQQREMSQISHVFFGECYSVVSVDHVSLIDEVNDQEMVESIC